eukprot:TRINITY_DN2380_c0_g1_i1.p1 TRINITY_DN2380_c0_g1~~TRINITY_DN2380_c0_g1_i1.p1  ORF type:complete len:287 (-),score=84.43 TRINITY_DN2380_c0_g1_i1:22-882(-)
MVKMVLTDTLQSNSDHSRDFLAAPPAILPQPPIAAAPSPQVPLGPYQYFAALAGAAPPAPRFAGTAAPLLLGFDPVTSPQLLLGASLPSASAVDRCVLIVSNLPAETTCDRLFALFGVYGDVVRVKVLFKKNNTALIQMTDNQQADLALTNLQSVDFFGSPLSINFSRHSSITLPRPGEAVDLTRDYAGSPLHRFRLRGSKNFSHICPPSATLHVSSVLLGTAEYELHELFARYGSVVRVRFFVKDARMALVQMGSVPEAVRALVDLHGHDLSGQRLRVSFTKAVV